MIRTGEWQRHRCGGTNLDRGRTRFSQGKPAETRWERDFEPCGTAVRGWLLTAAGTAATFEGKWTPQTLPNPRTPALGKIPEATGACFPRRLHVGMLSPFMTVISSEKNQVTVE